MEEEIKTNTDKEEEMEGESEEEEVDMEDDEEKDDSEKSNDGSKGNTDIELYVVSWLIEINLDIFCLKFIKLDISTF